MYSWVSTGLGYCWGYNIDHFSWAAAASYTYNMYIYMNECVPSLSVISWTISVEFFFYFHVCPLYVTWGTSFRPTLFRSKNNVISENDFRG